MNAALYARVSTNDQTTDNQLIELRRYTEARGWTFEEFVDHGISGATSTRPALDRLMKAARRRHVDVVIVWRLDRLGRSLQHLVATIKEWTALGVAFVSLHEGIDATTPAGKLQMHILAAIAEFEHDRIRERIMAGLARAKASGTTLGRRRARVDFASVNDLSTRAAAAALGVSAGVVQRERKRIREKFSLDLSTTVIEHLKP